MKGLKILAISALMLGLVACGGTNPNEGNTSNNNEDGASQVESGTNNAGSENNEASNTPTPVEQTDWKADEKEVMNEVLTTTIPFVQLAEGYMVEAEQDEEDGSYSISIYDESEDNLLEGYGEVLEAAGFEYEEFTSALASALTGLDMSFYTKPIDDIYALSVCYFYTEADSENEVTAGNYIAASIYDAREEYDIPGDGTEDSPYTVSQCLELIATYEAKGTSATPVYIIGSVKEVKKQGTSGDLQLVLEDSNGELLCYYVKMNEDTEADGNWSGTDALEEGDVLVIYGTLKAYQEKDGSITPEVNSGAYCVTINGYAPNDYFDPGYETFTTWEQVTALINEFVASGTHENDVNIPELTADEYLVQLTLDDEDYYDNVLIQVSGSIDSYLDALETAGYYIPLYMGSYGFECVDPNQEVVILFATDIDEDTNEEYTQVAIYNFADYYQGDYSFNKFDSWLDVDDVLNTFLTTKEIVGSIPEIEASEYYVKTNYNDGEGYLDCVQIDIDGNLEQTILDILSGEHYTIPTEATDYGYECISSTSAIEIDVLYDSDIDVTSLFIYAYADILAIE